MEQKQQQLERTMLSHRFQQALVTSLLQTESTISPEIQQAFLAIPREAFVSSFSVEIEEQESIKVRASPARTGLWFRVVR